jgi:hypothetical protein
LASTAKLFHTPDGSCYADIFIKGHRESWPIRSKGFRDWLQFHYYEKLGSAPNSEAMQTALATIEAGAKFKGPEMPVYVRTAEYGGRIYIDLSNPDWQAIEINTAGWQVINDHPVRFRRAAGMRPLPLPERGGSIELLRRFLNVKSDRDFVLAVSWLLAALKGRGPYPVLGVCGEQGSAKSTFCAILRALTDPNGASLRALPREDRDLFIAAGNGHVLAFDNVSGLPPWLSDTLCRLSTGGGFGCGSFTPTTTRCCSMPHGR